MKIIDPLDYVLQAKHVLIIGSTGMGKSWFAVKLAERKLDNFIFVNTQLEGKISQICEAEAESLDEILSFFEEGITKIEYIPPEDTEEAEFEIDEIRRLLFAIGSQMYPIKEPDSPFFNLILDEAHLYLPKSVSAKKVPLTNLATRGRRFGVRGIFVTQRPQLLSSTVINMCSRQVIFRTGQYESVYFKNYHIPIEGHFKWLKKPYHYLIYDGEKMIEFPPIR